MKARGFLFVCFVASCTSPQISSCQDVTSIFMELLPNNENLRNETGSWVSALREASSTTPISHSLSDMQGTTMQLMLVLIFLKGFTLKSFQNELWSLHSVFGDILVQNTD